MSTSIFGPIIQNAFVVRDMDAALAHWTKVMGVGPFYRVNKVGYRRAYYQGAPATPDYSIAIAYWGDIQVELVTQNCDSPSIYKEFLDEGHEGLLHHVCVTVDDMEAFQRRIAGRGFETLAELELEPEGRVLYLRGAGQRWPLVEVGQFAAGVYDLFRLAKDASVGWDGTDPVRML